MRAELRALVSNPSWFENREDLSTVFAAELVTAAYRRAGLAPAGKVVSPATEGQRDMGWCARRALAVIRIAST